MNVDNSGTQQQQQQPSPTSKTPKTSQIQQINQLLNSNLEHLEENLEKLTSIGLSSSNEMDNSAGSSSCGSGSGSELKQRCLATATTTTVSSAFKPAGLKSATTNADADLVNLIATMKDLNLEHLPTSVRFELDQLELELLEGDITQKGYDKKKAKLLAPYADLIQRTNAISQNSN
jgi:hypothetical protein